MSYYARWQTVIQCLQKDNDNLNWSNWFQIKWWVVYKRLHLKHQWKYKIWKDKWQLYNIDIILDSIHVRLLSVWCIAFTNQTRYARLHLNTSVDCITANICNLTQYIKKYIWQQYQLNKMVQFWCGIIMKQIKHLWRTMICIVGIVVNIDLTKVRRVYILNHN